MGQALYRKYRSMSLQEVVGQEHITETLVKAIKSGHISHAYLFTGPRGVGKTSVARILAHDVNNLPYDETQAHIDIIEIDAASNRRIDEIRELRDKIAIAPAIAKYKVYIIDEVHMLTREAFNALLKTLEEPPAHAIFILATTEAHRLPETIVSRTQRYIFRPIELGKAVAHLKTIAKKEKIDITDEALELVAIHGGGSFRDSISLLDQLGSRGGKVDLPEVQAVLGIPPEQTVRELLDSLQSRRPAKDIYQELQALLQQGYQPASIAQRVANQLRSDIVDGVADGASAAPLLSALLEVPLSHDPEAQLEVVLLRHSASVAPSESPAPAAVPETAMPSKPALEPAERSQGLSSAGITEEPPKEKVASEPVADANAAPVATEGSGEQLDQLGWQQVLDRLKQQYNTLYGIVRMAQPDFAVPGKLTLAFGFAFHQKRANEAKNRALINDAIAQVIGSGLEIICVHDQTAVAPKPIVPGAELPDVPLAGVADDDALGSISNIFGGGELIQSE